MLHRAPASTCTTCTGTQACQALGPLAVTEKLRTLELNLGFNTGHVSGPEAAYQRKHPLTECALRSSNVTPGPRLRWESTPTSSTQLAQCARQTLTQVAWDTLEVFDRKQRTTIQLSSSSAPPTRLGMCVISAASGLPVRQPHQCCARAIFCSADFAAASFCASESGRFAMTTGQPARIASSTPGGTALP
jgi:hypothetical protein